MEYAKSYDEDLVFSISCSAPCDVRVSPETLKEELTPQSHYITPKKKTNRSMWPDEELVGVEIDEEYSFSGSIETNKISLRFEGFDEFSSVYSTVNEWCDNSSFSLPRQNEFVVQSVTLSVKSDDVGLTLDDSKCVKRDRMGQFVYETAGVTGYYSNLRGWVSLYIDEDVTFQTTREHLEEFLDNNHVIIAPSDELVHGYQPREDW